MLGFNSFILLETKKNQVIVSRSDQVEFDFDICLLVSIFCLYRAFCPEVVEYLLFSTPLPHSPFLYGGGGGDGEGSIPLPPPPPPPLSTITTSFTLSHPTLEEKKT